MTWANWTVGKAGPSERVKAPVGKFFIFPENPWLAGLYCHCNRQRMNKARLMAVDAG